MDVLAQIQTIALRHHAAESFFLKFFGRSDVVDRHDEMIQGLIS